MPSTENQRGDISTTGDELTLKAGSGSQTKLTATSTADRTVNLPDADDTLVGKATTDTFTNKSFDVDGTGNSLTNVADANIKAAAAIAATKLADGSVDNTEFQKLGTAGTSGAGELVTTDGTQDLSNKTVVDPVLSADCVLDTAGATTINIGGTNATTVNVGRTGQTTVIKGDLQVDGTTTTVNSATLEVADANITVNDGGNDASAEGAGLTVERTSTDGSIVFDSTLTSNWKAGLAGSEIELANVSDAQLLSSKTLQDPVIRSATGTDRDVDFDISGATNSTKTTFALAQSANRTINVPDADDTLVLTSFTQTISGKTFSDRTQFSSTDSIKIPSGTTAQRTGSPVVGDIRHNSDLSRYEGYTGSEWANLGAGLSDAGEINYIDNHDFEDQTTTGWVGYDDGASPPTDGTGGTFDGSITNIANTTLRGSRLLSGTAFQHEGFSYDFSIDNSDTNSVLKVAFDYATGTIADLQVYVYDVTNATLINVSQTDVTNTGGLTNKAKYAATWVSTDSTSYRLIVHNSAASAAVYLDTVIVGPGKTQCGTPIGEWESFTPVTTWSSEGTETAKRRRVGDTWEIRYTNVLSGAVTSGTFKFTIPDSKTLDTTKTTHALFTSLGVGRAEDDSTSANRVLVNITPDNASTTQLLATSNGAGAVGNTVPFTWANNDKLFFHAFIPIAEFAGSSNFGTNQVEYASNFETDGNSVLDDNSSFAYGPNGSLVPSRTVVAEAGTIDRQVRFRTPIRDTDTVMVQVQAAGTGPWHDAHTSQQYDNQFQSDRQYGISLQRITGANADTDVNVRFGRAGGRGSGATYGSAGTNYPTGGGDRWRVVKFSSGMPTSFGHETNTDQPSLLKRYYDKPDISSSGSFSSGQADKVRLAREGNIVTMSWEDLSHSSSSAPTSSAGFIPVDFRPPAAAISMYSIGASSDIRRVRVLADGTFELSYYNSSFALTSRTTSGEGTISWVMDS